VAADLNGGARLKPAALAVRVAGLTIAEFSVLTIDAAARLLSDLRLTAWESVVAREILRQLNAKLTFLLRVGLGYLTLSRQTRTLSGGEAQRINLANQLGSQLVGTLYVLDEPSIGLHARDTARLTDLCRELAQAGNTVVVVEHDREFIASADHIVELGPGSGERGGEIVFNGSQAEFQKAVEIDPTYGDAFHNLGSSLAEQGKWEEAIGAYKKALAQPVYSSPETTYNNMGYAYWALDRKQEAEEAFRAALQLEPKLVPSHFWLGVLLQKEGKRDEARLHLRAARDLEPTSLLGQRASEVLKALGDGG